MNAMRFDITTPSPTAALPRLPPVVMLTRIALAS